MKRREPEAKVAQLRTEQARTSAQLAAEKAGSVS